MEKEETSDLSWFKPKKTLLVALKANVSVSCYSGNNV